MMTDYEIFSSFVLRMGSSKYSFWDWDFLPKMLLSCDNVKMYNNKCAYHSYLV